MDEAAKVFEFALRQSTTKNDRKFARDRVTWISSTDRRAGVCMYIIPENWSLPNEHCPMPRLCGRAIYLEIACRVVA